jgi:hypothetical protein
MKTESMKEVSLISAKDVFLFDCQIAGLDRERRHIYRDVLASFIRFTGNILVKDLTADHVNLYVSNLSDGPNEGEEHTSLVKVHYTVIGTWVYWLCVQDLLVLRSSFMDRPHLTELFPLLRSTRISTYCT